LEVEVIEFVKSRLDGGELDCGLGARARGRGWFVVMIDKGNPRLGFV
jgi:hypothetical protein